MATKPSWLNITPTQGSGNGTIENSASAHTGRVARTGTVTVTGVGVSAPQTTKSHKVPNRNLSVLMMERRLLRPRMVEMLLCKEKVTQKNSHLPG